MTRGGNAKNWVAWWAIWSLGCTIALGDVVRTVQVPAPGEVRVELSWQLDFAPDACLIIRETWPEGWRLKELPAGAEDMAVRQDGRDLAWALGLDSAPPKSGSISYLLIPDADGAIDETAFRGYAQTMQVAEPIEWPIVPAGLAESVSPDEVPAEEGLRLKTVQRMEGPDGRALGLRFSEQDPTTTIYVEYVADLNVGHEWRCIRTSAPQERQTAPGVVEIESAAPGFYRLRQ